MSDAAYQRIARIFPMLSATHDGEVLNAARALARVLTEHNLHWNDVADRIRKGAAEAPKANPFKKAPPPPRDDAPRRKKSAWAVDKEDVERAYPHADTLDSWSEDFMESIHDQVIHQGRSLSEKQRDKLNEILDKLDL